MRIKNTVLDNARGSIGNITYSQNGSGTYAKLKVAPTNPNSMAQQNQRNRFREMSGGFNSLTQAVRQAWSTFARTVFNPLRKTNNGQFSAIMAFKAIKLIVVSSMQRVIAFTATYDLSTPVVTLTSVALVMPASPPVNTVRPNILDSTGIFYPLALGACTLTAAGTLVAKINFSGCPATGLVAGAWTDENGTKFGLTFYVSEALKGPGYRPQNNFQQNLGFSQIITALSAPLAGHSAINVTVNAALLILNFKSFPYVGQTVLLTGCVVGENGTISVFDSCYVTLT